MEIDLEELRIIERKINESELHKAAIERLRTTRDLYVEKPSKYFLKLQKIRSIDRNITQLVMEDGRIWSSHPEIFSEE